MIPAHDEEQGIGRLLGALQRGSRPGEFETVVVCNGCTDRTAEVARAAAPEVRVVETPLPSKHQAVRLGDQLVTTVPRIYLDADVEIDAAGLRALADVLRGPVLAAAPTRVLDLDGVSWPVQAYQAVWERLPQVRDGLFARGVIALAAEGLARVQALPPTMSDDLAISEAFAPHERVVVADASVVVHSARSLRALVRRRVRAATGVHQLDTQHGRGADARTSVGDVVRIACTSPRLALDALVFLAVTVLARTLARRRIRRGDYSTWLRDDSRVDRGDDRPHDGQPRVDVGSS